MLTATYSLVAIDIERKNTRSILCKLQQYIQGTWKGLQNIDLTCFESTLNRLTQFDRYFHARKVEMYVIPALRSSTREADPLLAELESLSSWGVNILRLMREQLGQAFDQGMVKVNEVCSSMDLYCHNLLKRLAKEEEELLPIVQRAFSMEEWFSLAAKFLAEDAQHYERKRLTHSAPYLIASM